MAEDKEQQNKNDDLEKYYSFTYSESEHLKIDGLPYFESVRAVLKQVKKVQEKVRDMRRDLRKKLRTLRQQKNQVAKTSRRKDGKADENLIEADIHFCEGAIKDGRYIEEKSTNDQRHLEYILDDKKEHSYSVITDVALKPLPSTRANNMGKKPKQNQPQDEPNTKPSGDEIGDQKASGAEDKSALVSERLEAARQAIQNKKTKTPEKHGADIGQKDIQNLRRGKALNTPDASKKIRADTGNSMPHLQDYARGDR